MRKFLSAAAFVLIFTPAFAQYKNHNFQIALETSNYTYKEPSVDVKMSGAMFGVSAEYLRKNLGVNKKTFFSLDFLYMGGKVDYDGWACSIANPDDCWPAEDRKNDWFIESALKLGGNFKPSERWEISPYIGLGGRYLVDNKNAQGSYHRTSTYLYVPLGLKTKFYLPKMWDIGFNAELDWLLTGKQKTNLSDVNPSYYNITNEQTNGVGAKLSVKLQKNYKKSGIFAEPFLRYWKIQESDGVPYGNPGYLAYEPSNTTTEWGLKTGVYF
jgi:hypothetical protein